MILNITTPIDERIMVFLIFEDFSYPFLNQIKNKDVVTEEMKQLFDENFSSDR